jgi:hypothetical protein
MTVSIDRIKEELGYFDNRSEAEKVLDNERDDFWQTALRELLAYREGCDPAERLPDYDVPVRIQWEWEGTRCQTIATRTIYEGVEIWLPTNTGCNYVPVELVFRWHPLPGGE